MGGWEQDHRTLLLLISYSYRVDESKAVRYTIQRVLLCLLWPRTDHPLLAAICYRHQRIRYMGLELLIQLQKHITHYIVLPYKVQTASPLAKRRVLVVYNGRNGGGTNISVQTLIKLSYVTSLYPSVTFRLSRLFPALGGFIFECVAAQNLRINANSTVFCCCCLKLNYRCVSAVECMCPGPGCLFALLCLGAWFMGTPQWWQI